MGPPAEPDGPPGPACGCLLRAMAAAGVERAYILLREGKWDLPGTLGDGRSVGLSLAWLVMGPTSGPAETLARGYPFVRDADVVLGMPDILFRPRDAFTPLVRRRRRTGADVVLGLFPTEPGAPGDRVELRTDGRVAAVEPRPEPRDDRPAWALAVWSPRFTGFLRRRVEEGLRAPAGGDAGAPVGDVVQAALEAGLTVEGEVVSGEPFLDIGEPERLAEALRRVWGG